MDPEPRPRYPDLQVRLHTRNPYALVSAVRQSLRRLGVGGREIRRFTSQALEHRDPKQVREICSHWVNVFICLV